MKHLLFIVLFFCGQALFAQQEIDLIDQDTAYLITRHSEQESGRKVSIEEAPMDSVRALSIVYGEYEQAYRREVSNQFLLERLDREERMYRRLLRDVLDVNEKDLSDYKYKSGMMGDYRLRIAGGELPNVKIDVELDTTNNGQLRMKIEEVDLLSTGFLTDRVRIQTLHGIQIEFLNALDESILLSDESLYDWRVRDEFDQDEERNSFEEGVPSVWRGELPDGRRIILRRRKRQQE